MINVQGIHNYTASFQQRSRGGLLQHLRKDEKKRQKAHEGEVRPVNPASPTAVTTKPLPRAHEFSMDWRETPEYNPHGIPAAEVIHPDPVNANRMKSFKAAADALAAHADKRIDEMRKGGK